MPIIEMETDLFEVDADALVNPVNCVGVSGAGLAKEFKRRFPHNEKRYKLMCKYGGMIPGHMDVQLTDPGTKRPIAIIYFPTKRHYKDASLIEDIAHGAANLRDHLHSWRDVIKSVAIPALGCGFGGLRWDAVKPVLIAALDGIETEVILIPPKDD